MKRKLPKSHEVKEPRADYLSLKGSDLNELAASILKLIGKDEQKRATLVGLLISDVATKQEFVTLLNELKAMREASDRRFEASEKRFEAIESELKAMREASDRRFEASEKRFEAIESELKAMREASDRRFEASEKRFEAFEKRFEAIESGLKAMRETTNSSITALGNKIDRLGSRWGIMAEDTFTNALREVLGKAGFQVTKWRKTDTNAEYFIRPRDAEIDILVRDGKRIAIEVKSAVGIGDIEIFEKSVQFYERSESVKVDEKIMVGIHLHREVEDYARKLKIKIVSQLEDIAD